MDRRKFLSLFGIGVAGVAIKQAIPFGRVWSFPKKIVIPQTLTDPNYVPFFYGGIRVGSTIRIRIPQRFIIKHSPFDLSRPSSFRYETYLGGPLPEGIDTEFMVTHVYSGLPPGTPPVAQLKSAIVPDF